MPSIGLGSAVDSGSGPFVTDAELDAAIAVAPFLPVTLVTDPNQFLGAVKIDATQSRLVLGFDDTVGRVFVGNGSTGAINMCDSPSTSGTLTWGAGQSKPTGCTNFYDISKILRFGAYNFAAFLDSSGTAIGAIARGTPPANVNTGFTWVTQTGFAPAVGTTFRHGCLNKSEWTTGTDYLFACEYGDPTGGPSVYRSADGVSWSSVLGPVAGYRHAHGVYPDPYEPGHVYVTLGDGISSPIRRSTDSGVTWASVGPTNSSWQAVQVSFDADYVYFAPDNNRGGVHAMRRSDDTFFAAAANAPYTIAVPGGAASARYYRNNFVGAVDPSTGIFYTVACDASASGTQEGVFALDRVGAPLRVLDAGPAAVSTFRGSDVFIAYGYTWFGYYRIPLLTVTT